jgi:hypothetical protein
MFKFLGEGETREFTALLEWMKVEWDAKSLLRSTKSVIESTEAEPDMV